MLAYKAAIQIFNHLLLCAFRKTDKKIINEGIIKITEKITKISGDVGPIGV
jgi:predicted restriction endonuclease